MKLVPLSEIFDVEYGNKFDANKLNFVDSGINFVSRSSKNLGVVGQVEPVAGVEPYPSGLLTATMGGTYLLSAFVQPAPFYSAQNVKVLKPKEGMNFATKVFYCQCISANRRRYSTHGREANRSFEGLLVPSRDDVPAWVATLKSDKPKFHSDYKANAGSTSSSQAKLVRLDELFDVESGVLVSDGHRSEVRDSDQMLPYLRPSRTQTTSFVEYVDSNSVDVEHQYPRHTLYVSTNGQGSHTYSYVATEAFIPNTDVSVLLPKRTMGLQEKLYYAALITANRPRFSYGRKPKGERLKSILLPEFPPAFVLDASLIDSVAA